MSTQENPGETVGSAPLLVGAAEIDITPPVGTSMAGSLEPRRSVGIEDPLYIKCIVLESAGIRMAYVVFDLVKLTREYGERGIALSAKQTGIPSDNILWAASHTHTGPYTVPFFSDPSKQKPCMPPAHKEWLETLPGKMAECVEAADSSRAPAGFSRVRSFNFKLLHNRRILLKNGQAINTWNLGQIPDNVQSVGSSGPVDPEIGILAFDDEKGNLAAVIFHYSLHTNTNFGLKFSADYPAVTAGRLRERFGPQVVTLFFPGASGDINLPENIPEPRHREAGNALAENIIAALETRRTSGSSLDLASAKRNFTVPRKTLEDQEERILRSGWPPARQEHFRRRMQLLREEGKKEDNTVLQAWRIGGVGFASLPGELFVEWGLKIKRESPFEWTFPVELGGDALGYLVTEKAYREGGYEPLSRTAWEGVDLMVDDVLRMLNELFSRKQGG